MSAQKVPPRGTPAWDAYQREQHELGVEVRKAARDSLEGPDPEAASSRLLGLLYDVLVLAAQRTARKKSSWSDRVGRTQCENLAEAGLNEVLGQFAQRPEMRMALAEAGDPIGVAVTAARNATIEVFRTLPDKEPHDGKAAEEEDDSDSAEDRVVAEERRRIAEDVLGTLPAPDRVIYRLAVSPESDLPAADAEWLARRRGIPGVTLAAELDARCDRMAARSLDIGRTIEDRGVRIGRILENLRIVRVELGRRADTGDGQVELGVARRAELRRSSGLRKATPDELRGFIAFLQDWIQKLVARQAEEHRTLSAVPGEPGAAQADFHEIAELVGELQPGADAKTSKDAHNHVSYLYRKTVKKLRARTTEWAEDADD